MIKKEYWENGYTGILETSMEAIKDCIAYALEENGQKDPEAHEYIYTKQEHWSDEHLFNAMHYALKKPKMSMRRNVPERTAEENRFVQAFWTVSESTVRFCSQTVKNKKPDAVLYAEWIDAAENLKQAYKALKI